MVVSCFKSVAYVTSIINVTYVTYMKNVACMMNDRFLNHNLLPFVGFVMGYRMYLATLEQMHMCASLVGGSV